MTGKRERDELEELRERLRSQTDLYMEAEPLLPIARALREAIDARLLGEAGPIDVDGALDAAIEAVAKEIISSKLEAMDPELVLRMYAERVDDEELKQTLGRWAAARAQELEYEQRREQLRKEAVRSGSIALGGLDAGMRLRLGLFDPRQVSQARKDGSVPPARTMEVRLVEAELGGVELIRDTALAFSGVETLPAQTRGRIGSTITDADGSRRLEPRLQLHAPLGYDFGNGPQKTDEIVGFAEVDEGVLLLQGGS